MCEIFYCLETDLIELEMQLNEAKDSRMKLIVTDGVFSMDGEIAPLMLAVCTYVLLLLILFISEICDLGDKYKAMVFVDECHATGFMGKTGR